MALIDEMGIEFHYGSMIRDFGFFITGCRRLLLLSTLLTTL